MPTLALLASISSNKNLNNTALPIKSNIKYQIFFLVLHGNLLPTAREGNVFTRVCDVSITPCCGGRYSSYWNASLSSKFWYFTNFSVIQFTIEVSLKYIILALIPDLYYKMNSAKTLPISGIEPSTLRLQCSLLVLTVFTTGYVSMSKERIYIFFSGQLISKFIHELSTKSGRLDAIGTFWRETKGEL